MRFILYSEGIVRTTQVNERSMKRDENSELRGTNRCVFTRLMKKLTGLYAVGITTSDWVFILHVL